MVYCPNCGNEVSEEDKFCFACGAKLGSEGEVGETPVEESTLEEIEKDDVQMPVGESNPPWETSSEEHLTKGTQSVESQMQVSAELPDVSTQENHESKLPPHKPDTEHRKIEKKWRIAAIIAFILAGSMFFVGRFVGYSSFESHYEAVSQELADMKSSYEAVSQELADIKDVYPPREFASLSELQEWLLENDVSEKPDTIYAAGWFRKALGIQEEALNDGYIISADYDIVEDGTKAQCFCTAIVDGRPFFWDPETDEVFEEYFFGTVK